MDRGGMDSTGEQISDALKSVFDKIEEKFGARLLGSSVFRGELTFLVAPEDLVEVATYCKAPEGLGFDRLEFLTGNHYPERLEQPFEVAVQLTSMATNDRLRLKVPLKEGQKMPTLTSLWPAANWCERETWEMYGIEFEGHPNLIRLLTDADFEGHPLRKDFPVRGLVGGRIRTDLKGKI
ncbi:MAG TPA: NADH-quinone oxidoreductase subunit C [Thermoleophilia bacterium]|nr:NADH-quinone oxidoreductase subunit C [Thermoleophilia bacterium]